MRVAYVCTDPGIPVFGTKGASVHVQAVVRELVQRGAEVHLICARVGGEAPAGLESVELHVLPAVGKGPAADRERAAQTSDATVADVLDDLGAVDLVYERYALWGRTATAWAAGRDVASVLEVNAPLVEEQSQHRELVDRVGAQQVAGDALSAAHAVVCVSDEVSAWARTCSRRPDRVVTLANGVDTDRVQPTSRPVTPADAGAFVVGFVGTLKAWHGVEVLVEAMSLLSRDDPSWRLLVVGDGPRADVVHELATAGGVQLQMTGALQPAQVVAELHRIDVATAPYPDLPGLYFSPLKVYEYLAAGLPVVASAVGQVPAALGHGELGVLVQPGDAAALAAALRRLRDDTDRRTALRDLARNAAVERHTWRAVVDRVLELAGRGASV